MKRIVLLFALFVCGCTPKQPYANFQIPLEHTPSNQNPRDELAQYTIAYCLALPADTSNNREVDLVISSGDGISRQVISTRDIQKLQSPFLPIQEGHPDDYDLGCFSSEGTDIRHNGNELFWRPQTGQLVLLAGVLPMMANFRSFQQQDEMRWSEVDLPFSKYDHSSMFDSPRGVYWSPDGEKFATVGAGNRATDLGRNIWVYDFKQDTFRQITHFPQVGNHVATASWSSDSTHLAIGRGGPESGVIIHDINRTNKDVEITSRTNEKLAKWPYWLTSSWDNIVQGIAGGQSSVQAFNAALAFNSLPIWFDQDQSIIFTAAKQQGQSALFVINRDGNDLRELLPGLPGIVLMPRLSPDQKILAFARFPSWNDRSKMEIAVLELKTGSLRTLVVLSKRSEDNVLFINGMDWTPDSKYLAFGAQHEKDVDIFIIRRDGTAWQNLTADIEGDAVSPAWMQ